MDIMALQSLILAWFLRPSEVHARRPGTYYRMNSSPSRQKSNIVDDIDKLVFGFLCDSLA